MDYSRSQATYKFHHVTLKSKKSKVAQRANNVNTTINRPTLAFRLEHKERKHVIVNK